MENIDSDVKVNDYYNQSQENSNNSNRPKKRNRRKKNHWFLKFILIVLLIVIFYKTTHYFMSQYAEKLFVSFETYPLLFSNEYDTQYHITDDFELKTEYINKDKNYYVTWNTDSKYITIDDNGYVSINFDILDRNKKVVITEKFKWLFVEIKKDYDCILVTDEYQEYTSEDILDVDSIKDDTFQEYAEIAYREDGVVKFIYGDFNGLTVCNEKDAVNFVELYRDILDIDNSISLKVTDTFAVDNMTTYILGTYFNDMLLVDNNILLNIDSITSKPIKLNNCIVNKVDILDENKYVDPESYYDILIEYFGSENFVYTVDSAEIINGQYYDKLIVMFSASAGGYYYINKSDFTIIECNNICTLETVDPLKLVETVDVKGKDESGVTLTAEGGYSKYYKYILRDNKRNITINREDDSEITLKGFLDKDKFMALDIFGGHRYTYITNDTDDFGDMAPVEIEALKYIQDAYDFYKKALNIRSYNNSGSEIFINTNVAPKEFLGINGTAKDLSGNAAWLSLTKMIYIGNPAWYSKFTVINSPDVLVHEYTHAVFGSYNNTSIFDYSELLSSINEAYADVMACLVIGSSDWIIGKNIIGDGDNDGIADASFRNGIELEAGTPIYFRDLKNINKPEYLESIFGGAPSYYDQSDFDEYEAHEKSVLIGHLGYEMYASSLWTREELAKIWFDSMLLGYNSESDFVTVRRNLIQALDNLGYSAEYKDFVAYMCDVLHIFDSDYTITTEEYSQKEIDIEINADSNDKLYKTTKDDIPGHPMLDDNIKSRFLVFYATTDVYLNGGTVHIYEYTTRKDSMSDKDISNIIEAKLNESSNIKNSMIEANEFVSNIDSIIGLLSNGKDSTLGLPQATNFKVEYKKVPDIIIKASEKFLDNAKITSRELAEKMLGEDIDISLDMWSEIFNLSLKFYVIETTPYDLYRNM